MIEKFSLEQDPKIEREPEDFSDEAGSTVLVREKVRGTNLEGATSRGTRRSLKSVRPPNYSSAKRKQESNSVLKEGCGG